MPNQDIYQPSPSQEREIRPVISPRRKRGKPHSGGRPATGTVGLSPRQWEILQALPRFNGMLRLYQLRLLFYPFHLDLMLNMMVDNLVLARWWERVHEAQALYTLVDYAKLLARFNHLYDKAVQGQQLTQTQDINLWLWFEQVEITQPLDAAVLTSHRKQLRSYAHQSGLDPDQLRQHRAQLISDVNKGYQVGSKLLVTDHLLKLNDQQQALLSRQSASDRSRQKALNKLALNLWLTQAIEDGLTPPAVVESRPRYASGIANREVRDEVNDLIDRGLVDSYLPAGGGTACIYLSRKGRRAVAKQQGLGNQVSKVRWQPVRTYVYDTLEHKTAQNDLRIAMLLAAAKAGFLIKEDKDTNATKWWGTPELEARLGGVTVNVPMLMRNKKGDLVAKDKTVMLRLMDDFVWVDTGLGWIQPMAIELDNGTRTIHSEVSEDTISMKYRTWSAFCQSHSLKEYLPDCERGAWFLTITTQGEKRLRSLQQAMQKVVKDDNAARDRYWFTCLDWIHPSWRSPHVYSVFSQPIWLRGNAQEYVVMDLQAHAQRQVTD